MPSTPRSPSCPASSRGSSPCSNQSPTFGISCSRTNARTLSRIRRSSSESPSPRRRKSSASIGGAGAVCRVEDIEAFPLSRAPSVAPVFRYRLGRPREPPVPNALPPRLGDEVVLDRGPQLGVAAAAHAVAADVQPGGVRVDAQEVLEQRRVVPDEQHRERE